YLTSAQLTSYLVIQAFLGFMTQLVPENHVLSRNVLEPTYARTVFPCFDEPDMKATFNIRIVHDPSYVALSNMPAIGVSEMKDENGSIWTVTTFDTTPKMSTYITAFVVCDFDHMTVTERGKEIRIWARKEAVEKGCVDYALNITGPIFSFLEDLFNISYPLPKTDLVALPDFGAGAMENWGLMTFQESSLIYCPAENLINRKAFVSLIVSHEIGHQWFGNLVTMSWWNDLWLNEGFASYFEYVGAKYVEPKPPLVSMEPEWLWFVNNIFMYFFVFLTERLFLKALNSYLKAFSFSSANQDDLWTHIQMIIDAQNEVQLPASVKNIMDPWTCQDGFPVLTFDPSTGTISQEQFHNIRKKENTTSYNNTWIVPISWVRNGSSQPIVWLDETSKIFPEMQISGSEHDWILLNMNLSGYYRVNYNSSYLKRIGKLLENNPEVFPLVNRLQLIDDAFSLTESGYLEIESALDLTKYLAKENDIFVWYIVLSNLMPNDLECTLKDYEIYPLLKKYLIKKMLPVYHYYAGIIRQNADVLADNYFAEAYLEQLLRKACWLGLQDCLDLCSELYAKWMENPKNQIPAFVRRTIFCYGIAMGSDKEWEFAWEMYHHDNSTTHDKDILLYAMGCTRESWLLHRYMQSGINGSLFSSNNTIFLIYNLAATDTGLRIIWKFMTENWPLLQERYGNSSW
uniref:Laeverin n=1 Tax=Crocodylus porosus TaxID=8502 RepID=A0A7M4FCJ9_CROPO